MKNKWLIAGAVAAFVAFSATVQATLITGAINFQDGGIVLNSALPNATSLTFKNPSDVANSVPAGTAPTGSYALTGGQAVTFLTSGFTFLPSLSPTTVSPLWTFTIGAITYSFDLTGITSVTEPSDASGLIIFGTGIAHITGFTDTFSTFKLSATGSGTTSFGFVAGNKSVPDGGTTVMLLGAGLSGLALLRKKLLA